MNKFKARPDLMVILFIILLAIIVVLMGVSSYASGGNLPYIKGY